MNAAIYARKSTEQNGTADEARSVTRQIERATAYAESKGWTVARAHVYMDDGISGAEFDARRPGLAALLNTLTPRAPFQVVVMSEESRLGREQFKVGYVLSQLSEAGVRVAYYLEDRQPNLSDATGKLMEQVKNFAAEVEREKARQRTTDAMVKKAKAGHVTGGTCFGYRQARTAEGYVARSVYDPEAHVVRLIFTRYAEGAGYRAIAHELTAQGAPTPVPRRGRPVGWSPSSVREILHRDIYRGELVWNKTQKRDASGRKKPTDRPASEWIPVPMPLLRIVSDELWAAAHTRRAESRRTYLRSTDGKVWGKPVNGVESNYLLTGLATCGVCGGSLTPRSRSHGRARFYYYQCLVHVTRGPKVCANKTLMPLLEAETAVRAIFEQRLLRTDVVRDAFDEALRVLVPDEGDVATRRLHLEERLREIERELGRMTDAIVAGVPKVRELAERMTAKDHERVKVQGELQALDQLGKAATLDVAAVRTRLETILAGWRDPLGGDVAQARQVLRKLLDGRLVFTPTTAPDGTRVYEFTGRGVLDPVLAGAIPALLNNSNNLKRWWPQRDSNPCFSLERAVS